MHTDKKVLIVQCFNPNKGDNSVAQAMVSSLKDDYIHVSLTAFIPEKACNELGVPAYDYLFSLKKAKYATGRISMLIALGSEMMWLVYSLIWLAGYRIIGLRMPLPKNKRSIVSAYEQADLIVLPGGHFFTYFNSLINNFSHYYAMKMAQWLGKRTMVYAQTLGPFSNDMTGRIERWMMMDVLKKCNLVTVREKDSLNIYHENNVVLTAETVFIHPIPKIKMDLSNYVGNRDRSNLIVGFTVHHIYYKHYFAECDYTQLMTDIFDSIIDKYHCQLLLIPMEDNVGTGGDRPMISQMMARMKSKKQIHTIADDLSSVETANIIRECDLFVGTKTHSVVYGLKTATPTISISYQQKSTEFMRMFGLEDYAVNLEGLTTTMFMERFNQMMQHRDAIRSQLKEMNPIIREKARENNKLLKELLYAE